MILSYKLTDYTGEINIRDLLMSKLSKGFLSEEFNSFGLEYLTAILRRSLDIETEEYNEEILQFFAHCFNEKRCDKLFIELHKILCKSILVNVITRLDLKDDETFVTDGSLCLDYTLEKIWFYDDKNKENFSRELKDKLSYEWIDTLIIKANERKIFTNVYGPLSNIRKVSREEVIKSVDNCVRELIRNGLDLIESRADGLMYKMLEEETNLLAVKKEYMNNNTINSYSTVDYSYMINPGGIDQEVIKNCIMNNEYFTLSNFNKFLRKRGF